jgi:ZIP family zinc transporter
MSITSPVLMALLATLFTWGMTAFGAATVFLFKSVSRKVLDSMLGFAAGVMIAASFWSLLLPAIEMSRDDGGNGWTPALIGFLMGGVVLRLIDRLLPHIHVGLPVEQREGLPSSWHRSLLLVMAITIHNIPEGLAVGVAFGAFGGGFHGASLSAAISLALGIGIQNFPEGLSVAVPLRREGLSRLKCFWYGQLSGLVEVIAGVIGALAVQNMRLMLPYALAFAAGAMIFVVVEELIPESQAEGNTDIATLGVMLGFAVMMTLDVAFG